MDKSNETIETAASSKSRHSSDDSFEEAEIKNLLSSFNLQTSYENGLFIDVKDQVNKWCVGQILEVTESK